MQGDTLIFVKIINTMKGFIKTCLKCIYKLDWAVNGDNVKALLGIFLLASV
jgi:hypothetical protein